MRRPARQPTGRGDGSRPAAGLGPARALLETYVADPNAPRLGSGADLSKELDLATSDTKAAELLRQLPDERLAACAEGGSLPALDRIGNGGALPPFMPPRSGPRSRRNSFGAQSSVWARVERPNAWPARNRTAGPRIRATPAYPDLQNFVAAVRRSQARGNADPRVLAYLFRELNIADQAEQTRTLAELTGPSQTAEGLQQGIARQRLDLKDRFRAYQGFDQADRETFERLADQELDRLVPAIGNQAS